MQSSLGIIFDVDGVLIDSYQAHWDSWQRLCRQRDMQMTREQFLATFGRTSRETITTVWPAMQGDDVGIAELDDAKEAVFREILNEEFPAMDGAVELIDQLHEAGFALAVGSSGPPENVLLVLEKLDRQEMFQGVVTGTDVTVGKPNPQVFLLGAERMQLPPAKCLVIEDAAAGIEAAHAAGMKCVGLVSSGHTPEELADANLVVAGLPELSPTTLRNLME